MTALPIADNRLQKAQSFEKMNPTPLRAQVTDMHEESFGTGGGDGTTGPTDPTDFNFPPQKLCDGPPEHYIDRLRKTKKFQ